MFRKLSDNQRIDKKILGSLLGQYKLKMGKSHIAQDLHSTFILMASIEPQNGSNNTPASICIKKYIQKLIKKLKQLNGRKQESIINQEVIKQAEYFTELCQFIQNFASADPGSEGQKLKAIIQKNHKQAINMNQIDSFLKILLAKQDLVGKIKSQIESNNTSDRLVSGQKHQNPIDQEESIIQKVQEKMIQPKQLEQLEQPEQKQMNLVPRMEQQYYRLQNQVQVGNHEQVQFQNGFSQYGNNYNNQEIAESQNLQSHEQMSIMESQSQSSSLYPSDQSYQPSIYSGTETNYSIQSNRTDSGYDMHDRQNQDAMVEQHRSIFDSSDDSN